MWGRAREYHGGLVRGGVGGFDVAAGVWGAGVGGRFQTVFNEEEARFDVPASAFGLRSGWPCRWCWGMAVRRRSSGMCGRRCGGRRWCPVVLGADVGVGSGGGPLGRGAGRGGVDFEWSEGVDQWGHCAQRGVLMLARSDFDQPKYRGLSMFELDMSARGWRCARCGRSRGGPISTRMFYGCADPGGFLWGSRGRGGGWRSPI